MAKTTNTAKKTAQEKAEDKALKQAIKGITRQYGKGAVMRMDKAPHMHLKRWSTGSIALDKILGGGIPAGRIMELYGAPSAGKSTIALTMCAAIQKQGGRVAYIDAENALDIDYAKALGVDTDKLWLSQPGSGEEGLNIADALAKSSAFSFIVIDSVAALVPRADLEGAIGDSHVGTQARLMSQGLRMLSNTLSKTDTTILFINQLRQKVGVMFGNPNTTPGGKALKYYASIRLSISRGKKLKNSKGIYGNHAKIKCTKNKTYPPFKQIYMDILFGKGISHIDELLDYGSQVHVIDKGGAGWYTIFGKRLQGQTNVHDYVAKNPDVYKKLNYEVRKALHLLPSSDKQDSQDKKSDKASGTKASAKKPTAKKDTSATAKKTTAKK